MKDRAACGTVDGDPAAASRGRRLRGAAATALPGLALLGACDDGGAGRNEGAPPSDALVVFAASSLAEAFQDLRDAFEEAHPDVAVRLAFAGSQVLRFQIERGAAADAFASADERHMDALARAGLVVHVRAIADNELAVVVPEDNPAGLRSFWDLPKARRLVVGTPDVPVGAYARRLLRRAADARGEDFAAAAMERVVSEENNARLLRAKVELGVADAAIVYRTDARSGRVKSIPIPEALGERARIRLGVVAGAANEENARRWVRLVASRPGRRTLARRGFLVDTAASPE